MRDERTEKRPKGALKRLLRSEHVASAAGWTVANYLRLVFKTSKVIMHPADYKEKILAVKPAIFTCWHGHGMAAIYKLPSEMSAKVLAARHGDGDIAAKALTNLKVGVIRGAGTNKNKPKRDKGGVEALRAMLKTLNDGESVVMTADMPGGVPRQAGLGVITLARLSGRPIIPTATASSRYVLLNTWSRFAVHLPFSKLTVATADPIFVPREANESEIETARLAVENALNGINAKAYDIVGAKPLKFRPNAGLAKPEPGMLLNGYILFSRAIQPAAGYILRARGRRGKEIESRLGERYGEPGERRPEGPLWWFHAASVGETNAILPLLHELKTKRPNLNILLTTVTVTSAKIAEARLPEGAIHQFAPLDTPAFVKRFYDAWQPDAALFTESEIWPNLILEADRRGVPLMLLNARMSDRSFARWKRMRSLSRPLFSRFDLVLAQTPRLAKRLQKLGARNVVATGNIKFDAPPPPVDQEQLVTLQSLTGARPVLLAASTHPGEEDIVLAAHKLAARKLPGLLTIIAPRHPDRGPGIAALASGMGLACALRSQGEEPGAAADIYIADTIGELGLFYALSPVALIGGSLVRHGGQNPVEAIKLGAAVLTGPHQDNFKDAYLVLQKCGGCKVVTGTDSLARTVSELYMHTHSIDGMRERAELGILALSGALQRTIDALEPFLPMPGAHAAAPPALNHPLSYAT